MGDNHSESGAEQSDQPADIIASAQAPLWKRPIVVVAAIALLAIVLVGGSIVTNKRGLLRSRSASVSAADQVKTGDPNVVAAPGQPLMRVVTPPKQTRTEIRLTKDLGKPVFLVEFQPYGLASGGTAVIQVTKASARGGNQLASKFAQALPGQNFRVAVELGSLPVLKDGGRYAGTLSLVEAEGVSSFKIADVKPSN
jgi:hypothetical protein